jgi:hypothetical protein
MNEVVLCQASVEFESHLWQAPILPLAKSFLQAFINENFLSKCSTWHPTGFSKAMNKVIFLVVSV